MALQNSTVIIKPIIRWRRGVYKPTAHKPSRYMNCLRRYFAFKISFRAHGNVLRIYICRCTSATSAIEQRGGIREPSFFSLCECALHAITRNNEITSAVQYLVGREYHIIMFHSDKSFRFPPRILRFPVRTNIYLDAPVQF